MFVDEVSEDDLFDVVTGRVVRILVPLHQISVLLKFFFVHVIYRFDFFATLTLRNHFCLYVRLTLVNIVEEVFDSAEFCGPPRCFVSEKSGAHDRIILEEVILLLYLVDQVFFKNWIDSVILLSIVF